MLGEILAMLKTMPKIPLTSVMPRQTELPHVSQQPAKSLMQPDSASPVSPIALPEPDPKGIAMHKQPVCVFPIFHVWQQAKQAAKGRIYLL